MTENFKQAAEDVLGEDLTWFFNPWLTGKGYPKFTWDWRSTDSGAGVVLDVRVRQNQEEPGVPLFRMPVHVRYVSSNATIDDVRWVDGRLTEWSVDLPAGDWDVVSDPDGWLLATNGRDDLFPRLSALTVSPNPSAARFTIGGILSGSAGRIGNPQRSRCPRAPGPEPRPAVPHPRGLRPRMGRPRRRRQVGPERRVLRPAPDELPHGDPAARPPVSIGGRPCAMIPALPEITMRQ